MSVLQKLSGERNSQVSCSQSYSSNFQEKNFRFYYVSEKDLGFLRIGSLNVRVKKTTEAFSNFLGVGSGSVSSLDSASDKLHKGWGSADNVNNQVIFLNLI